MTSSLSEKADAFAAALTELCKRYPLTPDTETVWISGTTKYGYGLHRPTLRSNMIEEAGYGRINQARTFCQQSGVPPQEFEALVALIYG